jgi:hypothetical protein
MASAREYTSLTDASTLTTYPSTMDDSHEISLENRIRYFDKMPAYRNRTITDKLHITNPSYKYFSFVNFLLNLFNIRSESSEWIIAGILTRTNIGVGIGIKAVNATKQILCKKINGNIAIIINIIDSKKSDLNKKYSNKIMFFKPPYSNVMVYNINNFEEKKVSTSRCDPTTITAIGASLSSNTSFIVDPNKVVDASFIVEWFYGKSIGEINHVIGKLLTDVIDLQSQPMRKVNDPSLMTCESGESADVGGGKRRTINNKYAITPKITRVYRNKRYRSKRHSRKHRRRTSRRK